MTVITRGLRRHGLFAFILLQLTAAAAVSGQQVALIYTNNFNGIIESCDCPGSEMGGIAFIPVALGPFRHTYPDKIMVDNGDFLPMKELPAKAEYMLKFLKRLEYDAIGLGDQDFWFGVDYLLRSQQELALPFVNATLWRDSSLVFTPYISKATSGGEAAVIGYMGQEIFNLIAPQKRAGLRWDEHYFVDVLQQLHAQGKLIVVLNHAGLEACKLMAERFPFIDVIIAAHDQQKQTTPASQSPPFVLQAGRQGEYLGVARLSFGGKRWDSLDDYSQPVLPIAEHRPAFVDSLVNGYELANKKYLDSLERQRIQSGVRLNRDAACAGCHYDAVRQFDMTRHAHSYDVLAAAQKSGDPECLRCHTTAFGQDGGFTTLTATPQFRHIGCISCHTSLAQADLKRHAARALPRTRVAEAVCRTCHDAQWSPEFDMKLYRPAVLHRLRNHTIKSGETLAAIAKFYYGDVAYFTVIADANKLDIARPEKIIAGQKLIIPEIPPSVRRARKSAR